MLLVITQGTCNSSLYLYNFLNEKKIKIIGISAYFHDSSVALLEDGKIIYAAQEERFSRIKHDASFPERALQNLLKYNSLRLKDIDFVVF